MGHGIDDCLEPCKSWQVRHILKSSIAIQANYILDPSCDQIGRHSDLVRKGAFGTLVEHHVHPLGDPFILDDPHKCLGHERVWSLSEHQPCTLGHLVFAFLGEDQVPSTQRREWTIVEHHGLHECIELSVVEVS